MLHVPGISRASSLQGDDTEDDSKYTQLLRLKGIDEPRVCLTGSRLYAFADIQNEMLIVMSLNILREVAQNLPYFMRSWLIKATGGSGSTMG